MGAWTLVTIVGGAVQLAGFPTAGSRELHYFFPASILAGLLVWWVARSLGSSRGRLGLAAAVLVVVVAVGGLATLAVSMRSGDRPWFDLTGVKETAAASAYVSAAGGDEPIVFVFEPRANRDRPSWLVVRSTMSQDQLPRTYAYYGTIQDYLSGVRTRPNGRPQPVPGAGFGEDGAQPIVLVLQHYAPNGFREASRDEPARVISPGVTTLAGPLLQAALPQVRPPIGDTGGKSLAITGLAVALMVAAAGAGWAWLLLPPNALARVTIAPALGVAGMVLVGLAWAWVGLPLHGRWGAAPLIVTAAGGWLAALARSRARRPAPPPSA
jgi:hypothetical protein